MPRSRTPDLIRGTLDMMILKTLSLGPNHGYGVARRIRATSDDVLVVEEGSLYPALHRLQERGYVESEWRQSEQNRRARWYRLTPRGEAQLKEDAQQWSTMAQAIGKVMDVSSSQALRSDLA